jgi:hypothetical protein
MCFEPAKLAGSILSGAYHSETIDFLIIVVYHCLAIYHLRKPIDH